MLGNKWEQAQGTIIDAQTGPRTGRGVGAAMQVEHRYVVEVRKPTGEVIRGTVIDTSPGGYAVGTVIGVQVHTKSGNMRLDPNQRVVSVSAMINTMDQLAGLGAPSGRIHTGPRPATCCAFSALVDRNCRSRWIHAKSADWLRRSGPAIPRPSRRP